MCEGGLDHQVAAVRARDVSVAARARGFVVFVQSARSSVRARFTRTDRSISGNISRASYDAVVSELSRDGVENTITRGSEKTRVLLACVAEYFIWVTGQVPFSLTNG